MDILYAILLGLIEGITEYLPISSTGHLLIASELIAYFDRSAFLVNRNFRATFDIVIQIGAILAVMVYFRQDLWERVRLIPTDRAVQRFWLNIAIAFVPSAIAGLLLGQLVENPAIIGVALIVGGFIFFGVEAINRPVTVTELNQITPRHALIIGVAQISALIPGVSRSGATIVAGLLLGLERRVITTFTFYLALPTLTIATAYSLFKSARNGELALSNIGLLLIGTGIAFISAYWAVAWLLRYVSTHNFRVFGVYRIIVGAIILYLALTTTILSH
jgi:undecaprenyl-diphosphatase